MSKFQFLSKSSNNKLHIYIILFIFTFITCLMAGTQWSYHDFTEITNWHHGLTYAILILSFLSAHEFGHYIAARIHGIDATLPYYIPFPIPIVLNFGTLGAVIKVREKIPSKKILFDIGVSGPIAGFIVALGFLIYGLMTLPGIDFIYNIHPEYLLMNRGEIPSHGLHFGDTLLFSGLVSIFKNPDGFLPPMNEIYHYPYLNVGWFGLFVTTLNMLPMGQLDGGHIVYAMFGKTQRIISRIVWWILLIIGMLAFVKVIHDYLMFDFESSFMKLIRDLLFPFLHRLIHTFPILFMGWSGWLIWALIGKFFIKLDHPPIYDNEDIGLKRKIIGWLSLIILLLSFSYNGVYFV